MVFERNWNFSSLPSTSFCCSDNEKHNSRQGSAALITSTSYKDALEASLAEQKRKKRAQEKIPKLNTDKNSFVHSNRAEKKGNKVVPKNKQMFKSSRKFKHQESSDPSDDNEEIVLDDDSDMDCDTGNEDA